MAQGTIPTSEWKSEWFLSERNAELRRVLVQGVGYNRICEELGAVELDSWKEYSLLKINNYIEVDEWELQDANEPIRIDSEEFEIQSQLKGNQTIKLLSWARRFYNMRF